MKYLIILSILLISACGATGPNISQASVNQLQKGVTTTNDLRRLFGNPTTVTTSATGDTMWSYTNIQTSVDAATYIPIVGGFIGGADASVKTITITIDENQIVKDWVHSESQSRYNM